MQSNVDELVFGRDIDNSQKAVLEGYVRPQYPPRALPEVPLTEEERRELAALEATLEQEKALTASVGAKVQKKLQTGWEKQEYRTLRDA